MWTRRRLELQNLCELGRWLLEDPEVRRALDEPWRWEAYEACNSPQEWDEFLAIHRDDPRLVTLRLQYEAIDLHNQRQPRTILRRPVVIPQFDWPDL